MKILIWPEEILNSPCNEVIEFDDDLKKEIKDMKTLLATAEGVGLSANQVGLNKSMFISMIGLDKEKKDWVPTVFINPEVIEISGPIVKTIEGCLSLPGIKATLTARNPDITIAAYDEDGIPFQERYINADAICIQHELDHLEGKTMLDYMHGIKRRMAKDKVKKLKRKIFGTPKKANKQRRRK